MTFWPLVERELRGCARRRFTYYLRVIGAVSLLVVVVWFGLTSAFTRSTGGELFAALHLTLFASIWIFVPFLTADTIIAPALENRSYLTPD